ncbi:MAG: hypothetical protein C1943_00985 [Halochromatium sp.]|nr:hypothetical protein [Halochromatium sp.]
MRKALILGISVTIFSGTLWATNFCVSDATYLQDALAVAAANSEADEIWLVKGTYLGSFGFESEEDWALAIRGGYDAGCSSRSLDPLNTVLDANTRGRSLTLDATGWDTNLELEGVTIRNGHDGGLWAASNGDLVLADNRFESNTSDSFGGDIGGGAFVDVLGRADLLQNHFDGNWATDVAGGAYVRAMSGANLTNNSFSNNGTDYWCGGLYLSSTAKLEITSNEFIANEGGETGGGLCVEGGTQALLDSNLFLQNTASYEGGGLNMKFSVLGGEHPDEVIITNNRFSDNTSRYGNGGGLSVEHVDDLINNSFANNQAGEKGGAFYGSVTHGYNNLFWANMAMEGNDLYLYNDGSGLDLYNNNLDQSTAGFLTTDPYTLDPSNLNKIDPQFADPDMHLASGSPMIDAGDSVAPALPETDMDGDDRIIGAAVDIGADEWTDSPIAIEICGGTDEVLDYRIFNAEQPVSCTASRSITMKTGFSVAMGTEFHAYIQPF